MDRPSDDAVDDDRSDVDESGEEMEAVGEGDTMDCGQSDAEDDREAEYEVDSNDDSSYNPPDYLAELTEFTHVSDLLRGLNAMYDFSKRERDEKKQEEIRTAQDSKQERIEGERALAEKECPSTRFALLHPNIESDDNNLILKGRVRLPDTDSLERVDAVAIYLEEAALHALLVLKLSDSSLFPALCPCSLLPHTTMSALVAKKASAGKSKDWSPVDIDATGVKRGEQQLFFIKNEGPFGSRTCNKAMLNLLRADLVAQCHGQKRKVYGALPLAFDHGRVLEASDVYDITLLAGAMFLSHPKRSGNVPQRIFDCAVSAKNSLREEKDSAVKILDAMEELSVDAAVAEQSLYNQYLNVALGGLPRFESYSSARFVPCGILAAKHAYPKGSFRCTKCCCDINVKECTDPEAKKKMRKLMNGHTPRPKLPKLK
mmetsp:Transcript_6107/g.13325  ORF Transcript_6107/g.13325 Transcript_6107/m.13325 type:complete len:430 (+) Transcript_6107:163-1452(+)|eukprot:CAMPEP_0178706950 /NCGR_PEP_ID=MMETSP0699-20121125/15711_1 /TAXON_ID=265572 /ORGANISM="Extubocellulus spinifer, Strain CCMP396" /LENGTH=429 /DNA_ID=CAMNT_0020354847 /DNA_START=130 /DNA_END=1419 /DNA_ORIENTATION=+